MCLSVYLFFFHAFDHEELLPLNNKIYLHNLKSNFLQRKPLFVNTQCKISIKSGWKLILNKEFDSENFDAEATKLLHLNCCILSYS